jgi:hypothetical protein
VAFPVGWWRVLSGVRCVADAGCFLFLCAAYYVAFGPHGPRTPTSQPGDNLKIFLSTLALVGISGLVFLAIQSRGMLLCCCWVCRGVLMVGNYA